MLFVCNRCVAETRTPFNEVPVGTVELPVSRASVFLCLVGDGYSKPIQTIDLQHVALTSVYVLGDKDRMHDGTPKELMETMIKCWMLEPTSERIVEDVSSLEKTLFKIIVAKGCIVADEDMRSGRRQAKLNGDGLCKGRTRQSQRIATLKQRPTHPTALRALDMIGKEATAEFERLDAARLAHELLAFEPPDDVSVVNDKSDDESENGPEALNMDSDEDTIVGNDDGDDGEDDE